MPFVDVPIEYYDLSLPNRDATDDQVTHQAAAAIRRHGVGIKCATITPDLARMQEFKLKKLWKSPNGTLRAALNGTVFREPILLKNVPRVVPGWQKGIVVGRHAFGDQYQAKELKITEKGTQVSLTSSDGQNLLLHTFEGEGVAMAMFNTKEVDSFNLSLNFPFIIYCLYSLLLALRIAVLKWRSLASFRFI